jgi:hypothetical protein
MCKGGWWFILTHNFTMGELTFILLPRLQLTTPNFKVIRKVMPSWALIPPPPPQYCIPYLMFSLKSQYKGLGGVQIRKTHDRNPNMGTSNLFFPPQGCSLFR